MKVTIKNLFKKEKMYKCINNDLKNKKSDTISRRRKGAYIEENKKINLKNYFDNLFKNKNKLSRGYYILLVAMLILGGASVGITFKAYNLFAKEDYELYAKTKTETGEIDNQAVPTLNEVENVDNNDANSIDMVETTTENSKGETKENNKVSSNSTSNVSNTKNTATSVKPLSFSKAIDGNIGKPYSIDKVVYSKTLELWKTHDGIDISAEIGTNVKSIEKGIVEKVYEDSFYGVTVIIDHSQGYKSSYSNLDKKVSVKEKQTVNKGQVIGKIGNTSIGEIKDEPHLHFTLFKDNNNVDPTYIFK